MSEHDDTETLSDLVGGLGITDVESKNQRQKYLKCISYNASSINDDDRQRVLREYLAENEISICMVCETGLTTRVESRVETRVKPVSTIDLFDMYKGYHVDSETQAGGVMILIEKKLFEREPPEKLLGIGYCEKFCEILAVDLSFSGQGSVRVIVVYYHPHSLTIDEQLEKMNSLLKELKRLCEGYACLIVGDFNLPDIKWDTCLWREKGSEKNRRFLDFCLEQELIQYIHSSTMKYYNSINDLILCNVDAVCDIKICRPPTSSDHNAIAFGLIPQKCDISKKHKVSPRRVIQGEGQEQEIDKNEAGASIKKVVVITDPDGRTIQNLVELQ